MKTALLVVVLMLAVGALASQAYMGAVKDARLAGYAEGKHDSSAPGAPDNIARFARAFCDMDGQAMVPFFPSEESDQVLEATAVRKMRGYTCVSHKFLGSVAQESYVDYIFSIDHGVSHSWWVFSFRDGLVFDINGSSLF